MCGLVGVASGSKPLGLAEQEVFKTLLYLDVLRGFDSTGVALVNNVSSPKLPTNTIVAKEVGPPCNLINNNPRIFAKRSKQLNAYTLGTNIAIGHNRAATQGAVNAENAHPFDMGSVVGCHNGTVEPWSISNLTKTKHDVDSKTIFQYLSETKDLQGLWDVADGAMTLTWWDKDEETLNFATNGKRSFNYVWSKNKTLYWASEEWMLYVALSRSNVDMAGKPISLHKDQHHKFKIVDEVIEHTWTELNPFVETSYVSSWSEGFWNKFRSNKGNKKNSTKKNQETYSVFTVANIVAGASGYYAIGKSIFSDKNLYFIKLGDTEEQQKKCVEEIKSYNTKDIFKTPHQKVDWADKPDGYLGSLNWSDVISDKDPEEIVMTITSISSVKLPDGSQHHSATAVDYLLRKFYVSLGDTREEREYNLPEVEEAYSTGVEYSIPTRIINMHYSDKEFVGTFCWPDISENSLTEESVDTLDIGNGHYITQQDWDDFYSECYFCRKVVPWEEANTVVWLNVDDIACADCEGLTSNQKFIGVK